MGGSDSPSSRDLNVPVLTDSTMIFPFAFCSLWLEIHLSCLMHDKSGGAHSELPISRFCPHICVPADSRRSADIMMLDCVIIELRSRSLVLEGINRLCSVACFLHLYASSCRFTDLLCTSPVGQKGSISQFINSC